MADIEDVYPNDLIEKAAEELKKIDSVRPPVWAMCVKTGAHKEKAPVETDWWYTRAAAVLRAVYALGPVGVSKLRTKYGGKKRRGHQPPEFRKGSGSIIRKALQQLEKAGFVKQAEKGIHKGRIITPKGKKFLLNIAKQLAKDMPAAKKEKPSRAEEAVKNIKETFKGGEVPKQEPTAEKLDEEAKNG